MIYYHILGLLSVTFTSCGLRLGIWETYLLPDSKAWENPFGQYQGFGKDVQPALTCLRFL